MKQNFFHRVGFLRGLFETFILGGIFIFGLLSVFEQIPENALFLGMMYIGAGCALWFTVRLRIPGGSLWRKVIFEIWNTILLGFIIVIILPLITLPFGLWETTRGNAQPGFQFLPLAVCAPSFVSFRLLQYGWFYWDKLRKRKIIWGLMHTQLSVVVVLVAAFVVVGAVGITFQANEQFKEISLAATFAHRIVLTILPFLAISTVGLAVTLIAILPPAALASFLFSRRLTRRLESLAQTASALSKGVYTARVEIHGEDEIAQLQTDFNAMAADLESTLTDLQSERDKVAGLLDTQRQLTASVSHELRTPLATIQGYLEPALADPQTASSENLAIIQREIQRLQRLIDDLFTLSKAEVEALNLQIQPTDVCAVAQRMVETHSPLAWQRGRVEMILQTEGDIPFALVDEIRLEQILTNLLHNGVRHTPPGGIVAVVVSDGDEMIQVEVRDTGEGIDPDDLPLIWERFYRGSGGQQPSESGAGLGLALVKELTEAMDGSVEVASTLGEGSVFTIRLPKA